MFENNEQHYLDLINKDKKEGERFLDKVKDTIAVDDENVSTTNEYAEDHGFGEGAKPITKSAVDSMANKLDYWKLSANIGLAKGLDKATLHKFEGAKEHVKTLQAQRDAVYLANKDNYTFVDTVIGGIAESAGDPVETARNIIVGIATGGFGLGYRIVANIIADVASDVATSQIESKRYQDRELTNKELGIIATRSAIIGSVVGGIEMKMSKVGFDTPSPNSPKINVRETIETNGDTLNFKGYVQQDIQTRNRTNIADIDEVDAYVVPTVRGANEPITDATNATTVLQRDMAKMRERKKSVEGLDMSTPEGEAKFRETFHVPEGKHISKKSIYKDEYALSSQYNHFKGEDVVNNFLDDIEPTIKYNYERVKNDKSNLDPNVEIKPTVGGYGQVETAIDKILADFNTEKLYVQNEYLNIINQGNTETITVQQYLKGFDNKNKDVASAWANNNFKDIKGDRNGFLEQAYKDSVELDQLQMKTSLFDMEDYETFARKYKEVIDEDGFIDINTKGNEFVNTVVSIDDEISKISKNIENGKYKDAKSLDRAKVTLSSLKQDKANLISLARDNAEEYARFIHETRANEYMENILLDSKLKDIQTSRDMLNVQYNEILEDEMFMSPSQSSKLNDMYEKMNTVVDVKEYGKYSDTPQYKHKMQTLETKKSHIGEEQARLEGLADKAKDKLDRYTGNRETKAYLKLKQSYENRLNRLNDFKENAYASLDRQIENLKVKGDNDVVIGTTQTAYRDTVKGQEELAKFQQSKQAYREKTLNKLKEQIDKKDVAIKARQEELKAGKKIKFLDSELEEFGIGDVSSSVDGINPKTGEFDLSRFRKDVAQTVASKKKELAEQSIKLNQIMNKQKTIGSFQRYYDDSIYSTNFDAVKLTNKEEFIKDIVPFYKDGVLSLPEGVVLRDGDISDEVLNKLGTHFAEFVSEFKMTRNYHRKLGSYKTIGDLRSKYFNGDKDKIAKFFLNYRNGDYIKTNAEMIRDIFDFNTSRISRQIVFGSPSIHSIKNKFSRLESYAMYKYGEQYSGIMGEMYKGAKTRALNAFYGSEGRAGAREGWMAVIDGVRKALTIKYLPGSGFGEMVLQNKSIGISRAMKFDMGVGLKLKTYENEKMIKHFSKVTTTPTSKYTSAQLRKAVDTDGFVKKRKQGGFIGKLGHGFDTYLDFALTGQKVSDVSLRKQGDIISTVILDTLPDNYSKVGNELKSVIRMHGIDESNYVKFKDFTKKHIADNGMTVDVSTLVKKIEIGGDAEDILFSDALRRTHYQMADFIGNIKHSSQYQSVQADVITDLSQLFRGFSKSMNRDTLRQYLMTVNADGVSVYRATEFYRDFTKAKGLVDKSKVVYEGGKTVALLSAGALALGIGGLGRDTAEDFVRGDKTLVQSLAKVKVDLENLASVEGVTKLALKPAYDLASLLDGSDMITKEGREALKVVNTYTDEELSIYGRNWEEGNKVLGKYLTEHLFGRAVYNMYTRTHKDSVMDIKKIYGYTKEDQDKYEATVRRFDKNITEWWNKSREKDEFKQEYIEEVKTLIDEEIDARESRVQYFENDKALFENLPNDKKEVINKIIENNNIEDVEDFKVESAYLVKNLDKDVSDEMLVEHISHQLPLEEIDDEKTIRVIQGNKERIEEDFNKLPKKSKELFETLMRVKNKSADLKDKELFIKEFKRGAYMSEILEKFNLTQQQWNTR